jgi:hypothetical protein
MARNGLGHWARGTSGNSGGRPKPPAGLRTRLAELSPIRCRSPDDAVDERDGADLRHHSVEQRAQAASTFKRRRRVRRADVDGFGANADAAPVLNARVAPRVEPPPPG